MPTGIALSDAKFQLHAILEFERDKVPAERAYGACLMLARLYSVAGRTHGERARDLYASVMSGNFTRAPIPATDELAPWEVAGATRAPSEAAVAAAVARLQRIDTSAPGWLDAARADPRTREAMEVVLLGA